MSEKVAWDGNARDNQENADGFAAIRVFGTLDMTLGLEWKSPRGLLGGTQE